VIPSSELPRSEPSVTTKTPRISDAGSRDRMEGGIELPHSKVPRYFEFVDDSSSKFWEITLNGNDVTTCWGRIGSDGQSKTKSFGSPEKAQAEYDKLIAEKTEKGYVEVTRGVEQHS
jgi:predicted DNA-binding WGR domain protein